MGLLDKKNWLRKSQYRWDCGGYTISAAMVGGGYRYAAWHDKLLIDCVNTSEEARAVCQSYCMSISKRA